MLLCLGFPVSSPIVNEEQHQDSEADHKGQDEVLLNVIRPDYERPTPPPPVEPLYQLTDDGKVQGKHQHNTSLCVFLEPQ